MLAAAMIKSFPALLFLPLKFWVPQRTAVHRDGFFLNLNLPCEISLTLRNTGKPEQECHCLKLVTTD